MTRTGTGLTATALREGVGIALDSLRANKTRAALTILGIAIGVMVVMAMAAAVKGINNSVDDIMKQIGPTSFFVVRFQGGNNADDDETTPKWWSYPAITPAEAAMIRALPVIANVTMSNNSDHVVMAGPTQATMTVGGRSPSWIEVSGGDVTAGRSFSNVEEDLGEKVVVLSESAATILFGDMDPVGQSIHVTGDSYEVIGVYRPPPNLFNTLSGGFVIMPYRTFSRHVAQPWENQWASLLVRPRDSVTQQDALDAVISAMRRSRQLRPAQENNFAVVTQDKILENWNKLTGVFFMVMIALSGVGLMVGGIGVIAIMMISVTERTREIGVRKALGATRTEILWQFLIEAATLTLVGGAVGMALGGAVVLAIDSFTPLQAAVPAWSIAAALIASVLTGVVFGLIPANRAARLDPVEALRYE